MTGKLAGIARHQVPKGPMETLERAAVTAEAGVEGDCRGLQAAAKKGRKRQVSLIEAESVTLAFEGAAAPLQWFDCRRNLLVSGLRLPRAEGTRIAIGDNLVIEVTMECDPCERMDALHQGLRAALTPDWRGGFVGRVIADGDIAIGDEVRIV